MLWNEVGICPIAALHLLLATIFLQPMFVSKSNIVLKISTFVSCDILGHVAVRPAIYNVLYVVNYNHRLILHGYGDMEPQIFWGHHLDLFGVR